MIPIKHEDSEDEKLEKYWDFLTVYQIFQEPTPATKPSEIKRLRKDFLEWNIIFAF